MSILVQLVDMACCSIANDFVQSLFPLQSVRTLAVLRLRRTHRCTIKLVTWHARAGASYALTDLASNTCPRRQERRHASLQNSFRTCPPGRSMTVAGCSSRMTDRSSALEPRMSGNTSSGSRCRSCPRTLGRRHNFRVSLRRYPVDCQRHQVAQALPPQLSTSDSTGTNCKGIFGTTSLTRGFFAGRRVLDERGAAKHAQEARAGAVVKKSYQDLSH